MIAAILIILFIFAVVCGRLAIRLIYFWLTERIGGFTAFILLVAIVCFVIFI